MPSPGRLSITPPAAARARTRDDLGAHTHIRLVFRPIEFGEIDLEEEDAEHDVGREPEGEDQVAIGHRRRDPESDAEAEKVRMAREVPEPLVRDRPADREERRRKAHIGVFCVGLVANVIERLRHAEDLPVSDLDRGEEHGEPATNLDHVEDHAQPFGLDVPDDLRQRSPLPDQQRERAGRKDDIDPALHVRRHEAGEPGLPPRPRHDAVLQPEDDNEADVDPERPPERLLDPHVDRFQRQHLAHLVPRSGVKKLPRSRGRRSG